MAIIYNNDTPPYTNGTFVLNGSFLIYIDFPINSSGILNRAYVGLTNFQSSINDTNSIQLELWEVTELSSNEPRTRIGSVLSTSDTVAANLLDSFGTTTGSLTQFVFRQPYTLDPNKLYSLVIKVNKDPSFQGIIAAISLSSNVGVTTFENISTGDSFLNTGLVNATIETDNVPVSSTTFYFSDAMLTALNTNSVTGNGSNFSPATRPVIKSVQFQVDDVSAIDGVNEIALNEQNSFIQLNDNSKYYFTTLNSFQSGFENVDGEYRITRISLYTPDESNWVEIFMQVNDQIYIELDPYMQNADYTLEPLNPTIGEYVLSLTPVEWSGGGSGGGGQPSGPGVYDGKYVMTAEADPTQVELLVDGQPLPTGSVVKVGNQKYFKVEGDSLSFLVIPQTPPAEWDWPQEAIDAWARLQAL